MLSHGAPPFMKRSWKEKWWDVRDTIIENLEEFLTVFWHQGVKKAWDPAKALLGLVVLVIAGVFIISNLFSDGEAPSKPALEPPEYQEPPLVETPPDSEMEVEPSTEEDSGLSQHDQKEMKEVGISFVKAYTTYQERDFEERAEKIRPYVTDDIYEAEKKTAKDVPGNIPSKSRFEKADQIRVQSRTIREEGEAAKMIWLGTVYSITNGSEGEEEKQERIQLTFIPDKDKWKVAEVIYH